MSAHGLHLVLEPQLYRQSTKVENKGSHFPSLSFVSSFCHFFSSLRLFTLPFHFSLRLFSVSRSASLIHERSRVRRPSLDQFQFVKHVKSLRFGKRQKAKKKKRKLSQSSRCRELIWRISPSLLQKHIGWCEKDGF